MSTTLHTKLMKGYTITHNILTLRSSNVCKKGFVMNEIQTHYSDTMIVCVRYVQQYTTYAREATLI